MGQVGKIAGAGGHRNFMPLFEQVATSLRGRIVSGKLAAGAKLPAEPALAAELGVSRRTARRALKILTEQRLICQMKGRGTFVSYARDERVVLKKVGVVGWSFSGDDPYLLLLQQGLQQEFGRVNGIRWMQISSAGGDRILDIIHENALDGIIIVGPSPARLREFCELPCDSIPHVIVGRSSGELRRRKCFFVDSDNEAGTCAGIRYLIRRGHRRIAWVGRDYSGDGCLQQRYDGYCRALKQEGIRVDKSLVIEQHDGTSNASFLKILQALFRRPDRPTAAFAAGYGYILAVQAAVKNLGMTIPADVSLIAYGDEFHRFMAPTVTLVRQKVQIIGATAGRLMLDQFFYRKPKERQVIVKTDIIERESCRDAASASS